MTSEADGAGMRRRAYAVAWWACLCVGLAGAATGASYTPGGLRGGGVGPGLMETHGGWFVMLWPALVTGRWVRTGRWAFGPRF